MEQQETTQRPQNIELPKVTEIMDLHKRYGKVRINRNALFNADISLAVIFAQFWPVRIQDISWKADLEYYGFSPNFRIVGEGEEAPEYLIWLRKENDTIKLDMVEELGKPTSFAERFENIMTNPRVWSGEFKNECLDELLKDVQNSRKLAPIIFDKYGTDMQNKLTKVVDLNAAMPADAVEPSEQTDFKDANGGKTTELNTDGSEKIVDSESLDNTVTGKPTKQHLNPPNEFGDDDYPVSELEDNRIDNSTFTQSKDELS